MSIIHLKYKRLKQRRRRNIILNIVCVIIAGSGLAWTANYFWRYISYEITNDAFVDQYIAPINVRVGGYIQEVRFREHQFVHQGDTLVVLDNREYLIKQKEAASSQYDETSKKQVGVEAGILSAEAALDMANLNLSYTVVTAPYSGYMGRRTLEPGQYVSAGQTLSYIVRQSGKWITANYRETQIANIYIGQPVRIKVDGVPGRVFHGHVTAISEATGSKYSLVPTDNSAGNFVKVQQRIPVRIDIDDAGEESMRLLRAGMMVETEALRRK